MSNPTHNYISILLIAKLVIASLSLSFLMFYLDWDIFTYPDFYNIYSSCNKTAYTNILFSKLFCSLSSVFELNLTFKSSFFIFSAVLINTLMLIGYFKIFEQFLSEHGKYLLIILLVMHPYMNIYFFRFYTDLFASVGIFLITYYKIKNINLNLLFIASAIILMNLRSALIPVFVTYALFEIFLYFKKRKHSQIFYSVLLILFSIISYLPTLKFSVAFIGINNEINFLKNIAWNTVLALGYRESIGISRQVFVFDAATDVISFVVSLILIMLHVTGIIGVIKFSLKHNKSLLVIFMYLLAPILAIAHMRYLLPLMPVLMFGVVYIFLRKNYKS